METVTARLLGELRAAGHSWYRIARLCGVDDLTVRHWRRGRTMSDDTARRVCVVLGKSDRGTVAVLATLAQERAKDPETKRLWGAALKRLGGAVAAVAALFVGMPPPPAAAMVRCDVGPVYYVKSRRRRPTAHPKRRARWLDSIRRRLALTWAAA